MTTYRAAVESLGGSFAAWDAMTLDPSDCPTCGEWRDSPLADCANCGYHQHHVSEEADRGGAMDGTCLSCGDGVYRRGYGSLVGPWVTQ